MNKLICFNMAKNFTFALCFVLLCSFSLEASEKVSAKQRSELAEIRLKFAFINKFIEYIDKGWQEAYKDNIIIIDIIGEVDKEKAVLLKNFERNRIKNLPVKIRVNSDINDLKNSDIIYVTNGSKHKIEQILQKCRKSVLSVGDIKYFIDQGGVIEFYNYRGRVRFDIDDNKAKEKGIFFNAKLLELSEVGK